MQFFPTYKKLSFQWEKVQTGYDAKGRPVFTYKANHLGGYTEVKTDLDFRGKPTQVVTKHKRNSNGVEVKTTEQFTYDHQERLITHSHQINDGQVNYLSRNSYEKMGQLTNKKVGGVQANGNDRWQNINYKYNIRGWLTEINSNNLALLGNKALPTSTNDGLFSFKIHYNELNEDAENDFVKKLYNGNIAQAFWKTGSDNTERGYNYTYDQLNRLRRADFYKKGNPGIEAYGEFISYDLNGNITKLYRTTGDAQDNEIEMDDLLYEYYTDSNKLKNVSDAVSSGNTGGFVDGNTNPALADYEYDQNGNMVKDRNKGITNISYNHLNLPTEIIFDNTHKITYLYNVYPVK